MSDYQTAISDLQRLDSQCYDTPLTADQWSQVTSSRDYRVQAGYDKSGSLISYFVGRVQREGDGDCLKLLRLGVSPGVRRRGVCRQLLTEISNINCELELRETNLPGLQAAVKCGFEVVGLHRGRFSDCDGVLLYRKAQ